MQMIASTYRAELLGRREVMVILSGQKKNTVPRGVAGKHHESVSWVLCFWQLWKFLGCSYQL